MYEEKPKLTQDAYDSLINQFEQFVIGKGGLYSSVYIAALQKRLSEYDLSDIVCKPIVVYDPAGLETLKPKRSWWHRLWWGD